MVTVSTVLTENRLWIRSTVPNIWYVRMDTWSLRSAWRDPDTIPGRENVKKGRCLSISLFKLCQLKLQIRVLCRVQRWHLHSSPNLWKIQVDYQWAKSEEEVFRYCLQGKYIDGQCNKNKVFSNGGCTETECAKTYCKSMVTVVSTNYAPK